MRWPVRVLVAGLSLGFALPALAEDPPPAPTPAQDIRDAGREIGHATRDAATDIGHATRDTTRRIGHATRDTTRKIGHASRDAAVETGHAARDGAHAAKDAVTGAPAPQDPPQK